MSDFWTSKTVRARKDHRCPECRMTIEAGDSYVKHAGVSDGDFHSAIQCVPCAEFGERFVRSLQNHSSYGWDEATYFFGDMIEEAAEYLEGDREAMSGLSRAERRDAMLPLFDPFDEEERAYQKREREARKASERRRLAQLASWRMVRGMTACSAPPPLASLSRTEVE